ncbi:unnamed protein product, partial [Closterium sp. Naga37s-1]
VAALHLLLCALLLRTFLLKFPRSFTPGEALLLAQGTSLYAVHAITITCSQLLPSHVLPLGLLPPAPPSSSSIDLFLARADASVQALVLAMLLLPLLSSTVSAPASATRPAQHGGRTAAFYAALLLLLGHLVPLWLALAAHAAHVPPSPMLWWLREVMANGPLWLYWLLLLLLLPLLSRLAPSSTRTPHTIPFAPPLSAASPTPSTGPTVPPPAAVPPVPHVVPHVVLRKAFHVLALAMFLPPMLLQPAFLRLAFGVCFAFFLLLEAMRYQGIPPLSAPLEAFLRPFTDARDAGPLILSHFSLLLACMLPLSLTPPAFLSSSHSPIQACHVAPFAGLLSVGIGDTMASVVGVRWGRQRVASDSPKSTKPITLSPQQAPMTASMVACVFSALLEAFTHQLDNAFIPLLHFALCCL